MATNPKFSFPHPVYVQHVLDPYLQDAKRYYYGPMLAANKAHVVMLHRQAIISRENAQALVNAVRVFGYASITALSTDEAISKATTMGPDLALVVPV